jgi:hypothetical protein
VIKNLLTELFTSEVITVEVIFNTRIGQSLSFVKDFGAVFKVLTAKLDD